MRHDLTGPSAPTALSAPSNLTMTAETAATLEMPKALLAQDHPDDPIAEVIARWLRAAYEKSGSTRTPATYAALLTDFRASLQAQGSDLADDPCALAVALSSWARRPRRRDGAAVSGATRALRIAAVSAFYAFAVEDALLRQGVDPAQTAPFACLRLLNPARLKTLVAAPRPERREIYPLARAVTHAAIQNLQAAAATTSPTGKRDLALLALALTTGRRIAELRGLRVGDVRDTGGWERGAVTVIWRRTKGHPDGDTNLLAPEAIGPLRAWLAELRRQASAALHAAAPAAPVAPEATWTLWPRLDRAAASLDLTRPLGYTGLQGIYARRLGTTRTHRGRHTVATELLTQGASVVEIMEALGHADLKVTTTYLRQLERSVTKDARAGAVALGLGFTAPQAGAVGVEGEHRTK